MIIQKNMIETLKTELFMNGIDALEDFLGHKLPDTYDKDVCDNECDEIIAQMPDDIFMEFYNKYVTQNQNFYFTFGTDKIFPYYGGWIVIQAPNEQIARDIFAALYPRNDGRQELRFAFVYNQEAWERTNMYKENSNLGAGCHKTYAILEL